MKIPRRNQMQSWTPAERAIQDAVDVVEAAGAHPYLTEAVVLLSQARAKVADFVDGVPAITPWYDNVEPGEEDSEPNYPR